MVWLWGKNHPDDMKGVENPESLLMKIYGIYRIQIADSEPVVFLITENMVGLDKERIKRSFDLKGSILGRIEKIPANKLKDGSGL